MNAINPKSKSATVEKVREHGCMLTPYDQEELTYNLVMKACVLEMAVEGLRSVIIGGSVPRADSLDGVRTIASELSMDMRRFRTELTGEKDNDE